MVDGHPSSERDVQRNETFPGADDSGYVQFGKPGFWTGIIARLRAVIGARIPLGYEDETGFHVEITSAEE